MIRRADDRFFSTHDGVETWHSFSSGAHYDPDNIAHGMLVGVDEHVVAPGAGFDWHGHRGVAIVSWVVSGRLRHEDDAGRVRRVGPGEVLIQRTGSGIRHCEVNASAREPLRVVQMTLVDATTQPSVTTESAPFDLDAARFDVWRSGVTLDAIRWHAHVTDGEWRLGPEQVRPGDSVRGAGRLDMTGTGELLVWTLP
jgi:redox-sensitive bicupin YhaK (pirin superfamily)